MLEVHCSCNCYSSFHDLFVIDGIKQLFEFICNNIYLLKPVQDGGGKKAAPTSFSPATSRNVGMGPKNFLAFSFNHFATLV